MTKSDGPAAYCVLRAVSAVRCSRERIFESRPPQRKRHMPAVVSGDAEQVPTERKTGVKRAEVITVRLVRDERGWLRLAS